MTLTKLLVTYVTSSKFKIEENEVLVENEVLSDGTPLGNYFQFEVQHVSIKEVLEVDLNEMVRQEVKSAYLQLRIPCVVEHAGLIFEEYRDFSYPGGLTKPMWDTLGDQFIEETRSAGRRAIARAVVGYCDGMRVKTFAGETPGTISDEPRGKRKFYWDTVFMPDQVDKTPGGLTYAEIVDDPAMGLRAKLKLSQSTKAMVNLLEHLKAAGHSALWPRTAH